MIDDVNIISDTPYSNSFSKAIIAAGLIWIGSVIYNKEFNTSAEDTYNQHKRYKIKSETKLNREIRSKNRNTIKPHPHRMFHNYYKK